jgi:hypothetical protein
MSADREALWAVIEARDQVIARYERAHAGILQKQQVLEELAQVAQERERVIEALHAEARRREHALVEKEQLIEQLKASLREKEAIQRLNASLEGKEAVIAEQARALQAYRATFAVVGIFVVPLNHFVLGMKSVYRRTLGQITPRLGVLHQHPAAPLCVPRMAVPPPTPAPRISIVTPSFQQGVFIERTLRSVLEQDYPNLEYFVQDGGSKDGTVAILERYAARMSGYDSSLDQGQSQAINRAFVRTTGEIMAWLNSDDVLFPGALAYVADYFARHPEVDVIYGHRVLIDEEDREIGRWILPPHEDYILSWADFVPQETLFWRRSLWARVGGSIDESFRFAMDWDLLLRFRDAGARFARVPQFLGGFRVHAAQKTTAGISEIGFAEMDRLRERALGRIPTHFEIRKAMARYMLRHTATDLGWRIRKSLGMQA